MYEQESVLFACFTVPSVKAVQTPNLHKFKYSWYELEWSARLLSSFEHCQRVTELAEAVDAPDFEAVFRPTTRGPHPAAHTGSLTEFLESNL